MKTCTIGFPRDDGTFQILATLNNNDELLSDKIFKRVVEHLVEDLGEYLELNESLTILERQDAPDYIDLEEDHHE